MPRILVVDDLLSDRLIAGSLLSKDESISVDHAGDGVEALQQIERHLPDLVLTDLQMPEMDGLELIRQIRQTYPLIPTIVMTAVGSEDIAVRAIEQGAASYVPKKFLAAQLLETVLRILAASAQERSCTRLMHRIAETTYILENDLSLISSLVGQLRQDLQQRGICDESNAIRVATGLDEALLNAYYHGNLEVDSVLKTVDDRRFCELAKQRLNEFPYSQRRIHVTARYSPTEATFIIRDEGPGFNAEELPDPTDPEHLVLPCGRGLLLIRAFMDEVTFNDKGNEITMRKRKTGREENDAERSA